MIIKQEQYILPNNSVFIRDSSLRAHPKHYEKVGLLNDQPLISHAALDDIIFPPEKYNNLTIVLANAEPSYMTRSQINFIVNSLDFPANSSEQTRAELDYLLELQHERTPEEIERVMDLAQIGYWPFANLNEHPRYGQNLKDLFYECRIVKGEKCSHQNYPNTSKLLQRVMNDMRIMEFAIKYKLLRARPYQLEKQLKPLKEIASPSFASGHTLWAYIQAFALSELLPKDRDAFLELAYEIGHSREIMGVHYPSDEEAARQVSHRMLSLMWNTDKFQRDFQAAKNEWQE